MISKQLPGGHERKQAGLWYASPLARTWQFSIRSWAELGQQLGLRSHQGVFLDSRPLPSFKGFGWCDYSRDGKGNCLLPSLLCLRLKRAGSYLCLGKAFIHVAGEGVQANLLKASALGVDGWGRVPHLWVLSCTSCAADSSFLDSSSWVSGSWLHTSLLMDCPGTLGKQCPTLFRMWRCRHSGGCSQVTLYLAPLSLDRTGWGTLDQLLPSSSFHSVYHK